MADESMLHQLWNTIRGWADQNADKYLFVPIPKARTDTDYEDSPLTPLHHYFRIWLVEMSLAKGRAWFVDWYPAVHTSIELKVTGQDGPVTFSHVAQYPSEEVSKGVFLNYPLSDLLPYNGGLVTLESALLALKGTNYLQTAIRILQGFSGLVAPPVSQALAVTEKLSSGMQDLLNSTQGHVHLGFHQTFASQGGGGKNPLQPGYIAVILANKGQLDPERLSVKNDRLNYEPAGMPAEELKGFDYFLFRVEGRQERDDWRIKEIDQAISKAITAYLKGSLDEAESYRRVALTAAIENPYLAVYDRRRVTQAISDELDSYQDAGRGAVPGEQRDLNGIMAARAIPVEDALRQAPISFEEVFG